MIIQRWTARTKPMEFDEFISIWKKLNVEYQNENRKPWIRLSNELYGGHFVQMEREFESMMELDADEKIGNIGQIRTLKISLLAHIVEGSVELSYFQTVD